MICMIRMIYMICMIYCSTYFMGWICTATQHTTTGQIFDLQYIDYLDFDSSDVCNL